MEYGDSHIVAGFGASPNQNLGDMHTLPREVWTTTYKAAIL